MRLIIVRHGETVENNTGITQGQTNGTLSERGIEQTKKIALRLKDEKFDYAYSSDLGRTKKTTEEIMKYHPRVEVTYTEDLRERSKGEFDGKPRNLIDEATKKAGIPYDECRFNGGENLQDVMDRTKRFFDTIFQKHKGQTILIVSHGCAMGCMLLGMMNKGAKHIKEYLTKNTSVTIVHVSDTDRKIEVFDCVKHLK